MASKHTFQIFVLSVYGVHKMNS